LAAGLTDDEVRDQVVSLIGAGYDTTASTLAWMMVRLARHPDVAARVREEADRVLGDHGANASLPYTERVVRECLRLHPAGLMGVRLAADDLAIAGVRIRKGTLIAWSPYLSGRDPEVWHEPLRFDPDRFDVLDDEQRARTDEAWVPFGRGPHMCLGFALAQLELTLVTARVAQRLDLSASDPAIPRPVGMIVNRPEGGALVRIRGRGSGGRTGTR
jgi:cytochrome P450